MKKTLLSIGLLDKDTKTQLVSLENAIAITSKIFARTTGGATITSGTGVYTHNDGSIIIEKSLLCYVYDGIDTAIIDAVNQIKSALNQESIAIETQEVSAIFA